MLNERHQSLAGKWDGQRRDDMSNLDDDGYWRHPAASALLSFPAVEVSNAIISASTRTCHRLCVGPVATIIGLQDGKNDPEPHHHLCFWPRRSRNGLVTSIFKHHVYATGLLHVARRTAGSLRSFSRKHVRKRRPSHGNKASSNYIAKARLCVVCARHTKRGFYSQMLPW